MDPRRATIALTSVCLVGVGAGAVGFLTGAFDDLADDVARAVPGMKTRATIALALTLGVGVPQGAVLMLAARDARSAPPAAVAGGALLAVWVAAQAPLIGWTAPVQPVFFGLGIAQTATGLAWLRRPGRV